MSYIIFYLSTFYFPITHILYLLYFLSQFRDVLFCFSSLFYLKRHFAPWKESYDKSKQHIKKQRYYLADKVPYNQRFSSGCARRSKQSTLKEINPEYSLEGLLLKLKLQYFGHLIRRADSLEKSWHNGKDPDAGTDWRKKEKGKRTKDELFR